MSKVKARKGNQKNKHWWRYRKNRNRVWMGMFVALVGVLIAGFVWIAVQGGGGGGAAVGQQVKAFELPDVVSGKTFVLADYLGKKDVVIVSYMGFFCVGCDELLVELQGRQAEFEQRGAQLVVLGSLPEQMDVAKKDAEQRGITYPLVYDAETNVTKKLGLWSDHMEMPWMGYLIIDTSGRVAASDLELSEADGAAPANVEAILAALDRSRQSQPASSLNSAAGGSVPSTE